MRPCDVDDLTLAELSGILTESNKREQELQHAEWERIRWLGAVLLAPYAGKGKTIKPKDLITFPWEETKPDIAPQVQERLKEIGDKWDEEIKRRYGLS